VIDTAGHPVDLARLVEGFGPEGTWGADLVTLLRRNRVVADARTGVTIADLRTATRGGNPVVALVRNTSATRPGEALHWVVVDGVTTRLGQEVLAIRDPWGLQYFELTGTFQARFTGQAVVTLYALP
jgi:filamentous hemagglutinin